MEVVWCCCKLYFGRLVECVWVCCVSVLKREGRLFEEVLVRIG